MKTLTTFSLIVLLLSAFTTSDRLAKDSLPRHFGEPIFTDTASTIFFPTRYNEELLSNNKIALGGDYYANMIVYNFHDDKYRPLFQNDTYIHTFNLPHYYYHHGQTPGKNITSKWVFLLVKPKDYNESGRVDEKDPTVLFAATTKGDSLKTLTSPYENVVSFTPYDTLGFALLKIQRDTDGDKSFKYEDKDFYFRKLSLADLSLGRPVELK